MNWFRGYQTGKWFLLNKARMVILENSGSFERANGGQGYGVRNELRDVIIDFRAT